MRKQNKPENFRVVVYPNVRRYIGCSYGDDQSTCDDIAQAIRRHVDNIGCITIEHDSVNVCSFCGAKWTESSDTYNGGCCDKDEENNPNPPTQEG